MQTQTTQRPGTPRKRVVPGKGPWIDPLVEFAECSNQKQTNSNKTKRDFEFAAFALEHPAAERWGSQRSATRVAAVDAGAFTEGYTQ